MTPKSKLRANGEKGVAVIMTALCLLPMMAFAAFGVDLASFYSRASYLQKSADAAALAGTVWLPDMSKARDVACASLKNNGIDGGVCGPGDFGVEVDIGSTSTSLLVTVSDPSAVRYFSQVLGEGDQVITRSAEAEYNLPLPLGSPLNYFGGDRTQTQIPAVPEVQSVAWPAPYNGSRVPAQGATGEAVQSYNCGVDATGMVAAGGWTGNSTTGVASTYSSGTTSANRCLYAATSTAGSGDTATPPPDHTRRAPTAATTPCNSYQSTAGALGRWESATLYNAGARYTTGTGNRQCRWSVVTTDVSSLTPLAASGYTSTWYQTNVTMVPANRPCNVGWSNGTGGYATATAAWSAGTFFTGQSSAGNRLCRFPAFNYISTVGVAASNPIPSDRSPGFWAMIHGPGHYAAQGDPFSARCLDEFNCSSAENAEYVAGDNRGFWYVVDIPAGVTGSVDVNVFDAALNFESGNLMDSKENEKLGGGSWTDAETNMETEFRVYEQTNPLDFNARTPLSLTSNNTPANGGCWWKLQKENAFDKAWSKLCTIPSVQEGDRYLVNVRTNTVSGFPNSAGNNGYAMEVVLGGNRYANPGPNLYAYGAMGMLNRNTCSPTPCTPPPGTFYLAKIGPQYAGKTLVVELFDSGDVSGDAYVYPMMPNTAASGIPKPTLGVNPSLSTCNWTAMPAPNPSQNTGFQGARSRTGTNTQTSAQARDAVDSTRCGVQTASGGVRWHNGEWLRIRVAIPSTYTCDVNNNNPETTAGSCWWGVRYEFANGGSSDDTTWSARIDGNPVHLTE